MNLSILKRIMSVSIVLAAISWTIGSSKPPIAEAKATSTHAAGHSTLDLEFTGDGNCFYKPNIDHWCDFSRKATLTGQEGTLSQHFSVALNVAEDPLSEDFQMRQGKLVTADGTIVLWRDRITAGPPPYQSPRFVHQEYRGSGYIVLFSAGNAPGMKKGYTTVLKIDQAFDIGPQIWRQSETRTFDDGKKETNTYLFVGGDPRDVEDTVEGNISFFKIAKDQ